jgi:hypothetical protein
MLVRAVTDLKALLPIEVTELGTLTLVMPEQFSKPEYPILVTL